MLDRSPKQLINKLMAHIPHSYQSHQQMVFCREFLENNEWELALDSLIEFTDETQHLFPDDFWEEMAEVATKMGLAEKANYSRRQK